MSITIANQFYGTMKEGGSNDIGPRQKFKFSVEFNNIINSSGNQLPFPALSVQLPEISVESKVVQKYNVRRVVQQKANYGQCVFTLIDTFDNRFTDGIYLPYMQKYYNAGKGITSGGETEISQRISENFGYNTPTDQTRLAIEKIIINMDGGPTTKTYTLHGCFITSISNDTVDYSDSQPVTYTVTIQPEFITIGTPRSLANTESAEQVGTDSLYEDNGSVIQNSTFGTPTISSIPQLDVSEVNIDDLPFTSNFPDPEINTQLPQLPNPDSSLDNYQYLAFESITSFDTLAASRISAMLNDEENNLDEHVKYKIVEKSLKDKYDLSEIDTIATVYILQHEFGTSNTTQEYSDKAYTILVNKYGLSATDSYLEKYGISGNNTYLENY